MTNDQLRRDLKDINHLLATVGGSREPDEEDLADLRWLEARRESLTALLAARHRELDRKVVRLAVWRDGRKVA